MSRGGKCTLRKKWRLCNLKYYARDLFNTLIDSRWRVILWIFVVSFVSSWFIFGLFWWVIAYAHDDLLTSPHAEDQHEPCVTLVEDMVSAFMFSLETQYTTGYGTRSPTTQCPEAIFLICVQSIFGMLQESVMVGIVFAKLSRPKARSQAILFSEKAVVCMRDGRLHLMVRVADVRKSNLIGCKLFCWILTHRTTKEGEQLPNYQRRIKVSVDEGGSNLFLLWPVTVTHRMDRRSPLYDLSAVELLSAQFEVVVSLVCTSESTGQSTEAKRSYTPSEIFWGHRFQTMMDRRRGAGQLDYALFDKTVAVETPLCSQRQLDCWSQPCSPLSNDLNHRLLWEQSEHQHKTDTEIV
ncbi:hypothetical protein AAG570_012294 [Ranatra chinensis]|uniref:Uncharacterized protein n=1 Tax=Ranatra chinensis TaxID=642074 RepID=A0ABD0YIJ0_9HEMI